MSKTGSVSKSPEFSIIIPVYGVEEYLHECVDSALSQTFGDFEIILVDDGSLDHCAKICDEYQCIDPRIKVIHKANGGLSDSRNIGLAYATGKFIYFLDGDDWIEKKLLENTVFYIRQDYDMVAFNTSFFCNDKIIASTNHETGTFEMYDDYSQMEFFLKTLLFSKIGWSVSDRVFKKSIIDENRLTFADNIKIFTEDLFFSCCYCAHINKILSIEDKLFYYRQREGSIMHTAGTGLNFNRYNEFGKELEKYYHEKRIDPLIEVFPQIYYSIFRNNIWKVQKHNNIDIFQIRELIYDDVKDIDFFRSQMSAIKEQKNISVKIFSERKYKEMLSIAKYFLDGNTLLFRIRNKLINAFYKNQM